MENNVLIVPACTPGQGGGHLMRCIKLVKELHKLGRGAFLFLQEYPGYTKKIMQNFNPELILTEDDLADNHEKKIDFVILDRFQTSSEELSRWKQIAPVIGIDEGGISRDSFDFLIDILPNIEKIKPNISDPCLLHLPKKNNEIYNAEASNHRFGRRRGDVKLKVLISFGQEDAAGLGFKVAKILSDNKNNEMEITLLKGRLNCIQPPDLIPTLRILESIPNLAEHLHEYDLIITHYGITAFEALYADVPVLLVNPTAYHEKLSKAAGFKTIKLNAYNSETANRKLKKINTLRLSASASDNFYQNLIKHCKNLAAGYGLDKENTSLAELINSFSPQVHRSCPVCCCTVPAHSIARFNDRTYRCCSKCGIIYMDRICPPPIEYERDYFFEQYKKQYGKTYLEDFPNLLKMAKPRLQIIKNILPQSPSQQLILDIGCAYGAFLSAAKYEGFEPHGIDPCKEAVEYVQKNLDISAAHGLFPVVTSPVTFSVITLWFVIEHFHDCVSVFKEVNNLLKPGGILAFSTPSFAGISSRKNLRNFLFHSPCDHWTIWSPKTCKKTLSLSGFKVKKIVICGHHPQRFPFFGKLARSRKSPVYWLLLAISKLFRLGDTFEVYAEKNN